VAAINFKTRVWYKELCSISFYVSFVESNSLSRFVVPWSLL
jgi:hypothetical protein